MAACQGGPQQPWQHELLPKFLRGRNDQLHCTAVGSPNAICEQCLHTKNRHSGVLPLGYPTHMSNPLTLGQAGRLKKPLQNIANTGGACYPLESGREQLCT